MSFSRADKIARLVLQWAAGLYPPEKRVWGEAILAEVDMAAGPWATLRWTAGGLMVALRLYCSNLFSKLSRGTGAKGQPAFVVTSGTPPLIRWKRTLGCLIVSAALLCAPEMRQALNAVAPTWKAFFTGDFRPHPREETARWEKIGREAEARGDAATMAFAALRLAESVGEQLDDSVRLAQHAVAKDPSLTWTYYFLSSGIRYGQFTGAPHPELLKALRQWDPDNAVPYIATAEDAAFATDPAFKMPEPREQTSERHLADAQKLGSQWREWMDRAFAAPIYDDYIPKRLDLDRRVMRQLSINDPMDMLATAVWVRGTNLYLLHVYGELCFSQGAEYEHTGRWEQAAGMYWSIAQFAQRMRLRPDGELAPGDVVDAQGSSLEHDAFERLQLVLLKLGRTQEAQVIAAAAQEERREENSRPQQWGGSYSSALWIHIWALLTVLSGLLTIIALCTFAARRSASPFVRFALSCTSPFLVLSCAGLLLAYHPYAQGFSWFLNDPRRGNASTAGSDSFVGLRGFGSLLEAPQKFHWWVWANDRLLLVVILLIVATTGIWAASHAVRRKHA